MKHKVLDLKTKRGKRIFADLKRFYPVEYGIQGNEEFFHAEGYTHIIEENGKIHKV